MSHMRDEIHDQPQALARFLEREAPPVCRLVAACRSRGIRQVFIAARGTSDHAAVYAKYLIEIATGLPVCLAAASVFTLYGARLRLDDALVLGISQSGRAGDACDIIRLNREAGRLTACITNHPDSDLGRAAEHVISCEAGEEKSLPATKTYTTSLAAVAAFVAQLAPDPVLGDGLGNVPALMAAVLDSEPEIEARVPRYRYMEECVILARGYNQCTALETALKLTETSYIRAIPYSTADFLHGPIAAVEQGTPCLVYAPSGRAFASVAGVANQLAERGAELIVISDDAGMLNAATSPLALPVVPEALSPLVAILVGQLFAFHLARQKGRDPDRPRGLTKVIVTH